MNSLELDSNSRNSNAIKKLSKICIINGSTEAYPFELGSWFDQKKGFQKFTEDFTTTSNHLNKGMPCFEDLKWDEEDAGPHGTCYVNAKGKARKNIVELLERNGFKCEEDEITTKESTISSKFPLKISFDDRTYGHVHTVTSSAAAEASRRTIPADEFMFVFECAFAFVIV